MSTSSDSTMEKIRTWLKQCEHHGTCNRWNEITGIAPAMPTRLLKLVPSTANEPRNVKLAFFGQDQAQEAVRYATLSHCWGDGLSLRLLQQNLKSFPVSIEWERLPKTFQEAISVCLRLDICYLWIDALCIIQDSHEDWAHEAGRMTHVYANSFLNILAADSRDSTEGLFRDQDPSVFRAFSFPPRDHKKVGGSYVAYSNTWRDFVSQSPLCSRAWTIQERFLAPRAIYFSGDQVHWECADLMTSEGLPHNLDQEESGELGAVPDPIKKTALRQPLVSDSSLSKASIHDLWASIAQKYSRSALSFESDKSAAIAGLARVFCNFQGFDPSDYLIGLWRPYFIKELTWLVSRGERLPDNLNIPSWSWLSTNGDVVLATIFNKHKCEVAELIQAVTHPIADLYGPVLVCSAKLRAPLCQGCLLSYSNSAGDFPMITLGDDVFLSGDVDCSILLDSDKLKSQIRTSSLPVYLLFCSAAIHRFRSLDSETNDRERSSAE